MSSKNKQQGSEVEAEFQYKALKLGLVVSKPFGDNNFYDFIVDGNNKLSRIQIKSTSQKNKGSFKIKACYGTSGKRKYKSTEIDFIVVKIIPEDIWYIIPSRKVTNKSVSLYGHVEGSKGKYEKYKDNWSQLS